MNLKQSVEILGLDKTKTVLPAEIIEIFEKKYKKTNMNYETLILSKNRILKEFVAFFKNKNILEPRKNTCHDCKGLGFHVYFKEKNVSRICPSCFGTGWKTVPCKLCNGVGGNPECICKGSGRYLIKKTKNRLGVPCKECDGEGIIYKKIPVEIQKTEICSACGGTGFIDPFFNPSERLKMKMSI